MFTASLSIWNNIKIKKLKRALKDKSDTRDRTHSFLQIDRMEWDRRIAIANEGRKQGKSFWPVIGNKKKT